MIDGNQVLVVVPARGGSKGVKLKNLRTVGGVPLVARVGHLLSELPWVDRAVVSTDNTEIARVATESGLEAPFMRPDTLSGDRIGDLEVLVNALEEMEGIDAVTYDIIVMLQPTSPLRTADHVTSTLRKLIDENWDSVWTVSETDSKSHPLKQLTISDETEALDYYDPNGGQVIARQQLGKLYHRNGAAYAIRRDCLLEQGTIKGARTGALVMDGEFVSIDTEWDFRLVDFILASSS
jgi:CMP-N,N'-diacetyllegionaminic acid synthase